MPHEDWRALEVNNMLAPIPLSCVRSCCNDNDKAQDVAMTTTQLEIWSAMENLCKPDPRSSIIKFEPVRDKLIDMYGAAADDINMLYMFRIGYTYIYTCVNIHIKYVYKVSYMCCISLAHVLYMVIYIYVTYMF